MDLTAIRESPSGQVADYDVRTTSVLTHAGTLSGGNQQKVIVAREMSRESKVLLASQPTRGLDVGSIEFVHKQIVAQRDSGVAVVIVSSELDEIYALSDRIAVMYEGQIVGFCPPDTPEAELGLMMAGGSPGQAGTGGQAGTDGQAGPTGRPVPAGRPRHRGARAAMTDESLPAAGLSRAPRRRAALAEPAPAEPPQARRQPARARLTGAVIIQAITEGSPAVITILAIFLALVVSALLIVFSDPGRAARLGLLLRRRRAPRCP